MIPEIALRIAPYAATLALLLGAFVWGDRHRGAADAVVLATVKAQWAAQETRRADDAIEAIERVLRIEKAGKQTAEETNERVSTELDRVRGESRMLANRLYAARKTRNATDHCSVSATAGSPESPDDDAIKSGSSVEIENAIAEYTAACAADSAALAGWQKFYSELTNDDGR